MKTSDIKKKVEAKTDKAKEKIAKKCGNVVKAVAYVAFLTSVALLVGCSTADAPTAQRAQSITAKDITVNISVPAGCTNAIVPNLTIEIATAAQANETSGTETSTATPTLTPTNDIKPTTTFTYGLNSAGTAGTDWISQLTSASAQGLANWLKSDNTAKTEMTVTKKDGSTETVVCEGGVCSPSSTTDTVTCTGGNCTP